MQFTFKGNDHRDVDYLNQKLKLPLMKTETSFCRTITYLQLILDVHQQFQVIQVFARTDLRPKVEDCSENKTHTYVNVIFTISYLFTCLFSYNEITFKGTL